MPRGPRLDAPQALHHVMARGIEGRTIFETHTDRSLFVDQLSRLCHDTGARVYAWALLPNHFHLLLRTGGTTLSSLLRRLLTGHAVRFNRRHHRQGHLFQNRFKSILVEDESYLLVLVRYIHLNPLRVGLVRTLQDLDGFPWSGHAALIGRAHNTWQATAEVLALFGPGRRARRAYRHFIVGGSANGNVQQPHSAGLVRNASGWQYVHSLKRGREAWSFDERLMGDGSTIRLRVVAVQEGASPGPSQTADRIALIIEEVARECGLSPAELRGSGRRSEILVGRGLVARRAARTYGLSLAQIARGLQVSNDSVRRALSRAHRAPTHASEPAR